MLASTLKPGLLIHLSTTISGGVRYARTDIRKGRELSEWQTIKTVQDPEDLAKAIVARGKARSLVTGVCATIGRALLCPMEKEADLDAAVSEARAIAEEHNRTATSTRVELYIAAGRIAASDEEAARLIASEVRSLMEQIEAGIAKADPEMIREAANKARQAGQMLAPEAAAKVSAAIAQARSAARELVKRVGKAGEQAADVVAELNIDKVQAARFAFLDLDDQEAEAIAEFIAPAAPAVDLAPALDVDALTAAIPSFANLEI